MRVRGFLWGGVKVFPGPLGKEKKRMKKKRMCKICGIYPAEVRDRNNPTNPRKTICRKCHGKRLQGDMAEIHKQWRELDRR